MERGWDTKLGDDLLEEEIRDCLSPFVSWGKCLNPPQDGIYPDQEVLGTFGRGHVSKVKLLVSSRKGTSSLMGRKRGATIQRVRV